MSVKNSRPVRKRRTSEDARAEALGAARVLLLEQGPAAVTLKAVAGVMGVTHANLLHHFGSAGALQAELMAMMIRDLVEAMRVGIPKRRTGEMTMADVVGQTFDAFGKGGAGHLAAWLVLNRETKHLQPIGAAVRELAQSLTSEDPHFSVERAILFSTMMAFADAVIGPYLRPMLDQPETAARDIVVQLAPETMAV